MIIDKSTAPQVSVIMPAYNAELFIEEAINSVLAQSFTDFELIIIDDESTDKTTDIIKNIAEKDPRVCLVLNDINMGVAKTRNRGLDLARGEYVALLDSDDYWKPSMLEKMTQRIEEMQADIAYCSYEIVDEGGEKMCNDFIVPQKTTFEESIIRSVITCSTVLLTSEFAKSHRFPTDVYHEDIALWFQALRDGASACGVDEILAAYRQRRDSRSAGKLKSAYRRWIIYRKHLKLPLIKSVSVMMRYAYYGIVKFKRI